VQFLISQEMTASAGDAGCQHSPAPEGARRRDRGWRAGGVGRTVGPPPGGGGRARALRFAFYGRVSTEDWQDPVTSLGRQWEQSEALVRGHGRVVAEFCDVGESRSVAWGRRPQAAEVIAALADPDRGWDAVVVGEYERAFYGSQYAMVTPLLQHYGVQLWTPEAGGRVDFASEHDERAMTGLGLSSKREVTRTSVRVRTAMATQTREQGRYLGGRPPYGYRLGDAGLHPNRAHAAWGRRAHKLEPDPETAHVVRWVFAQRLAGHSVARIARALNEAGIPCPSAADPGRNPHRPGTGWTLGTVTTILGNPRYTGDQVLNRQRTDKDLADPADVSLGHKDVQRWNLPDGWVISRKPAHEALVSEADYIAAQGIGAIRGPAPRAEVGAPERRAYLLAGLLRCGACGRRMESAWSNGRPAYRCRHGRISASAPDPARPKNAFIREDRPAAPARPAPAPDRSRRQRRAASAPHPPRSRRPAPRQPRGRHRGTARQRRHPDLRRGSRDPARGRRPGHPDRHPERSRLTSGPSGPSTGPERAVHWKGARKERSRSPGAGGSPHPGDNPPCPETGSYGDLLCPRGDLNPHRCFHPLAPQASASAYSATRTRYADHVGWLRLANLWALCERV
jgi:site-specific DNA recombinase